MTEGWTEEMMEFYRRAQGHRVRMNDERMGGFMRAAARANIRRIVKAIIRRGIEGGIEVDRRALQAMAKPDKWPPERSAQSWQRKDR